MGKNAGEWTGKIEISKEEIPGSRRSMHGYVLLLLNPLLLILLLPPPPLLLLLLIPPVPKWLSLLLLLQRVSSSLYTSSPIKHTLGVSSFL